MSSRIISFKEAIREAQELVLRQNSDAILIGEGAPDPKAVFGTTTGLYDKFPTQVFDMPVSENGMTGVCIGAALNGLKPILVHMRIDFSLYSFDQLVNNAAKWFSMYGGQTSVPIVIRMLIGRGWGQGNQHSQNLTSLFAHIPGLKIVVPSNALDAKALFLSSFHDPNPVIFIEHRWLYETTSHVPEGNIVYPSLNTNHLSKITQGQDVTIVTSGHAVLEAIKAEKCLRQQHVSCDLLSLQIIRPLNLYEVFLSVQKTGRLIVIDDAWPTCGLASEIISQVAEKGISLKSAPIKLTYPDYPSGSSPALTKNYYTGPADICAAVEKSLGRALELDEIIKYQRERIHDVPDKNFRGPF